MRVGGCAFWFTLFACCLFFVRPSCALFVVYHALGVDCCLLGGVCCFLSFVMLLFVVCCFGVCCLVFGVWCFWSSVFGGWRLLCWLLVDACCCLVCVPLCVVG